MSTDASSHTDWHTLPTVQRAWRLSKHFFQRFATLQLPLAAAGLTYYAIFSLGPILLLVAGGLVLSVEENSSTAQQFESNIVEVVTEVFPDNLGTETFVRETFDATFKLLQEDALLRSIISLVLLLWSASGFFTSLQIVLEGIFDDATAKSYWQKRLVAVLLIFLVGIIISVELVGSTVLSYIAGLLRVVQNGLGQFLGINVDWHIQSGLDVFSDLLRFIISSCVFVLSFRYLTGDAANWRGAMLGGILSASTIAISRALLPVFFNLERFNLIYGIITSALLIMFWLYISLLLFLVGAMVAADVSGLHYREQQSFLEVETEKTQLES